MNKLELPNKKMSVSDFFKLIKDIPKNLRDTEAKTRAILSIFPFLEQLFFSNKDKQEQKQLISFVNKLSEEIEILGEEKINKDFFNTTEFFFLFKKILEKIRFEYKGEKIKLFRNFLLNSLRKDKPKINFSYFLDRISMLELGHFKILEWYYTKDYTNAARIGSDYDDEKKKFRNDWEFFNQLENDLNNVGFLATVQVDPYQKNNRYLLSDAGKKLFEFIQGDDLAKLEDSSPLL